MYRHYWQFNVTFVQALLSLYLGEEFPDEDYQNYCTTHFVMYSW